MQQSVNQQSVYAQQNYQQNAFTGQFPDNNQQVQNILPLSNQQLTNIQQNQQQYIASQQPANIISSVQQIHQFNNQQPTNFMQQQQQYGTSQQSVASTIPSQQIQQSINQQLTNIPQSQQHYIVPEQSSVGAQQVQQLFNQLPTKIPQQQQQQQHMMSQQSPDIITEQQTHHFIYQQSVPVPQVQHQYVSSEQTSDSKTSAHQVQQFINKQPTDVPQVQQQHNVPVQTSNFATSAQQPQQVINNQQLKTSQNQQQFISSNQGSDNSYPSQVHQFVSQETTKTPHKHQQHILPQQASTTSTELHIQHFSDRQPTKTPQTQQQFAFAQQTQGNIHSDQQIKQFINQKTTKTPQAQQQYATAETSDHTSSKHHTHQINYQPSHPSQNQQFISTGQLQDNLHKQQQSQHFINLEVKPDIPKDSSKNKLAPIPNQSVSIPQTLSSQENQNSKISEFASDSSHSQQSEQYFVDLDHDPEHSQHFQQEFQNEEQMQETNNDESAISYQQYHEDQNSNEDTHQHQFQQQHNEDRYSALKPIAQIVTADPQANTDHDGLHNEEYAHGLHSNKKPVQQLSANAKRNDSISDMKLTQHSVPPFDRETTKTHAIKSRPSVTPHPHFHPVGYQPSSESEDPSHDLFPAPSRPLKQKPEIHQEDWVDQEFVEEEDIHPEAEAYEDIEYEDYETPSATTTTTTTTTTTKRPMQIKRKPSRRPPIRFSPPTQSTTTTTTTSKPHQQEFIESFDNHQPDYKKPIDFQEFIDEYETTTPKKYTYLRPTTTRRPSTKSPIKFSFPAVSPTAEAYGLKKEHTTKVPVNPFASYPCPTPHCNGYNCSLIRGSDGCQKCVCDSPCAPCPQHCVKTKTVSEGRCPICDCTGVAATALSDSGQQCQVIECGGTNCRKVRDNNGCYTCICDPQCAEPKCDPGCEVLTNVPPGQCPGCVCRVTVVQAVVNRPKNCPAVQCTGPLCRTTRGPDGCLQCLCDACPPPKCDPGCELQTDVAQGQCPTCVCPSFNDDDTDQEEEPYCPNLFCADYGCREVPGPAGCPICMCDPICETPVCEPGCEVVTNKHMGKCPVCICSSPHANSNNSSYSLDGIKSPQQEQQHPVTFSANDADENETEHETEHETEPTEEYVQEEETTTTTTEPTTTTEMTTTTEATTTTCPAPVCSGLRCSYETGEGGCEVCKCRYKCPKPKCVGNCYAETNAPAHRCPGCVCPSRRKPPTP